MLGDNLSATSHWRFAVVLGVTPFAGSTYRRPQSALAMLGEASFNDGLPKMLVVTLMGTGGICEQFGWQ